MSGGRREQGGLDLRSPVRISDFVVAGTANRICGSMAEWGGL